MKTNLQIRGLENKAVLEGRVRVSGAKNDALKAMASSLLFEDGLSIENTPCTNDLIGMEEILKKMGLETKADWDKGRIYLKASENISKHLDETLARKMRASVVATGPILSRFGEVSFPAPGGCVIGQRPIDAFIFGYERMGAKVEIKNNRYLIKSDKGLRGAEIFFDFQTVGGTETLMMAGVLARGKTVLRNCAMEPEIKNLADFLNLSGAKIKGAGTTTIEIEGVDKLLSRGKVYKTMPDRIEAGSFLILGALLGKNILLENVAPENMEAIISVLRKTGTDIEVEGDRIKVKRGSKILSMDVRTHEYPGFPTDLQPQISVYFSVADGESKIFETIFENRFKYTEELIKLGADITIMNPREIIIKGKDYLRASDEVLKAHDIRAGFAIIIASLVAEGVSIIEDIEQINRGYERLTEKLASLGVSLKKINIC